MNNWWTLYIIDRHARSYEWRLRSQSISSVDSDLIINMTIHKTVVNIQKIITNASSNSKHLNGAPSFRSHELWQNNVSLLISTTPHFSIFCSLFFFSFSMKDVLVDPLSLRSFLSFVPFLNQLERNEETQKTLGLNTNEKLERQDKNSLENVWWGKKKKLTQIAATEDLHVIKQKSKELFNMMFVMYMYIYTTSTRQEPVTYIHMKRKKKKKKVGQSEQINLFYFFHIRKQNKSKVWVVK